MQKKTYRISCPCRYLGEKEALKRTRKALKKFYKEEK